MKRECYHKIENYMLQCMNDSAHDKEHIYRVLYTALDIAKQESKVDMYILVIACLLHDIGRKEQFENPKLCHAQVGSKKAFTYLIKNGFDEQTATHVKSCIASHRFRSANSPESIEAKILFDADKLDVTGAIGIARTLLYNGHVSEPLYSVDENLLVLDGTNDSEPSFFQEYKYKLECLYDKFYTKRGTELAKERENAANTFYHNILKEVKECYEIGISEVNELLKE